MKSVVIHYFKKKKEKKEREYHTQSDTKGEGWYIYICTNWGLLKFSSIEVLIRQNAVIFMAYFSIIQDIMIFFFFAFIPPLSLNIFVPNLIILIQKKTS